MSTTDDDARAIGRADQALGQQQPGWGGVVGAGGVGGVGAPDQKRTSRQDWLGVGVLIGAYSVDVVGSIRRIGGPTRANFSPVRSTTRQLSGSVHFPNKRGVVSVLMTPPEAGSLFSSGFDIRATPFESNIGLHTVDNQPHNAAATISATQQIASASHIVVTFNFRFGAHYGLNSDIAACAKRADRRHGIFPTTWAVPPP